MRTLDQNKRIWKLVNNFARATDFSREYAIERMHDFCEEISGQRQSSQLTEDQADEVINKLQEIIRTARKQNPPSSPFRKGGKRGIDHDPDALATNQQLAILNQLFLDVGMDTDIRQMRFCERVIKSSIPITRGDVLKVHEALEAMYVRRFTDADIDNMLALAMRAVGARGSVPLLTPWERGFIDDLYRQINLPCRRGRRTGKYRKLSSMKLKKLKEIYQKVESTE